MAVVFRKRHYAIYYRYLFTELEERGPLVEVVEGYWNARRKVKLYNDATLSYGWYHMKRLK